MALRPVLAQRVVTLDGAALFDIDANWVASRCQTGGFAVSWWLRGVKLWWLRGVKLCFWWLRGVTVASRCQTLFLVASRCQTLFFVFVRPDPRGTSSRRKVDKTRSQA